MQKVTTPLPPLYTWNMCFYKYSLLYFFGEDMLSGDIGSVYLNAETKEKIYTKLGVEFGTKADLTATVQKELYGLKSSGNAFYMHLCDTLKKLGFKQSLLDPALWYRLRYDKKA